ncbi:MAG TPA: hypothetical protein VHZ54_11750 [Solirubrobacterales bacterium]|nr:hypothetical protein [Solirubrobacterales bacterium]
MADPYEVDDEGRPVVEADAGDAPAGADPAAEAVLRRQIEQTLRAMMLSTLVGLVVIVVLAIAVSSIRGVLILVGIVYLASSLAAQWYLRRKFMARLKGPGADLG